MTETTYFCLKSWFFCETHKKYRIDLNVRNIIINRLKNVFLPIWGLINDLGWKKKSLLKNIFEVKFWSFWVKNVIFRAFSFWPYPYFGRKQTNCPKKSAKTPKCPKSWSKIFWWPFDQKWLKKSKKLTPPIGPMGGEGSWWNTTYVGTFTGHVSSKLQKFWRSKNQANILV